MAVTLLNPYCTLSDVQKETRNDDVDLEDWFKECINRASRAIEDMTERDFLYHDYSTVDLQVKEEWVFGHKLIFPWRILTLTEIAEDGTIMDEVYYHAEGSMVTASRDFAFVDYDPTLTVKGTFGYQQESSDAPSSELPSDIRRACTLIASAWTVWNRKEVIDLQGQRQSILDTAIPDDAKMIVSRYRKRYF